MAIPHNTIQFLFLLQFFEKWLNLFCKSIILTRIEFYQHLYIGQLKIVMKQTLSKMLHICIGESYSLIDKTVLKQNIGIPIDIDPVPLWKTCFLYSFYSKYVQQLFPLASPRTYGYYNSFRPIDYLYAVDFNAEIYMWPIFKDGSQRKYQGFCTKRELIKTM